MIPSQSYPSSKDSSFQYFSFSKPPPSLLNIMRFIPPLSRLVPVLTALFLTSPHVRAVGEPVIHSFTASQASVIRGTDVILTWDVTGFDELQLDGTPLPVGDSSLVVTPLVTTTYTLVATNTSGSASANLSITVVGAPVFVGAEARFVEVSKNDLTATRFHISEIEVFEFGIVPDGADADGTSRNDLVQNGNPSTEIPPTTTSLQHGLPASVFDGDIESGGEVWTTASGLSTRPRYMLDLGATKTIDKVRIFGRGDGNSPERLENFTVTLYEDDGTGKPGAAVSEAIFSGTAPAGLVGHVELSLAIPYPGIRSFTVDKTFVPQGRALTFSWEVQTDTTSVSIDNGVGDVTALTDGSGAGTITLDPGPAASTIYSLVAVRPQGSSLSSVSVTVTDQPLVYSFGAEASIVPPGTAVALSWEVDNTTSLTLDGTDVTGSTGTTVTPATTTTYLLAATNPNGTTTEAVTVRVALPGEPIITEFLAANETDLPDEDGESSDWIEIHNPTGTAADMAGYYLTDDPLVPAKWQFPAVTVPPGGYLLVFASGKDRRVAGSELHANFSLSRDGEYLALVKPDGATAVTAFAPAYPPQQPDVSYGYDEAGLRDAYFPAPTPGAANSEGFTDFVGDTAFSLDRGFYDAPITVAITTSTPNAEIRYTTDGSKPTATEGLIYTTPVPIAQTTVLRAAAFRPGFIPTNVDTQTYIFPADVIAHPNMRTSITQDPVYGPQMVDSLMSVPTISLVFPGDVDRTEKEASVEFINFEAGDTQLEAGMERFGNYVTNFAKRSIRLNFRSEYGPKKLTFPVFEGHDYDIPPAAAIDSLDLRSGNHDMVARGAYLSNRFTDDTMIDMGQLAPHGRFVHVYLNGIYWGQYHLRERWNGAMLAEYFGGTKDDYEAINANNTGGEFLPGVPYDGTGEYWTEARNLVAGPAPFSSAQSHIDMANVIDFMLLWLSGNSESEFRSAGAVPLGVPFKFFMKDADGFLRSTGRSVTHNGPLNIMTELRNEGAPDYKILLADRIHKHFFNDGAFTPARNIARLRARRDESRLSFLSEAARWDYRTPASWESYQDNLINNHFPGLTSTMIGRFQAAGMYPSTVAPTFSQHGGTVPTGFQLSITAPAGTIYYTLDGSDPRLPADPVVVDPPVTLVAEAAAKTVHVPVTAADGFTDGSGTSWNQVGFDDSGWTAGTGGVGYERGSGYESYFTIDVESTLWDKETSCLIRVPFAIAAGALDGMNHAELRVRYDDGYIAYLNGTEIARKNFTGTPDGDSAANANHSDTAAVALETVDITAHLGLLNEGGDNVLAIHGLNVKTSSSDFLVSADLRVSEAPAGGTYGAISPTAIAYTGPVPIETSTMVRARVLDGGNWSAVNEAVFARDLDALVISEVMYNPPAPTPAEVLAGFTDKDSFEFIELFNTGAGTVDLTGMRFIDGITFDFDTADITSLPAGGRILLVRNRDAFEFRYGGGLPVAGQYDAKLSNKGERLELADVLGLPVRVFTYDDEAPWPTAADGDGPSLVLADPQSRPDHGLAANWQAGAIPGGTPGRDETAATTYAAWAATTGAGAPDDDPDHDGLTNFLEFMLGGNPMVPSPEVMPTGGVMAFPSGAGGTEYLALTLTHNIAATGVAMTAEVSSDLVTWQSGPGFTVLLGTTYNGDGTATSTFRCETPVATCGRQFIRVRFASPEP